MELPSEIQQKIDSVAEEYAKYIDNIQAEELQEQL